MNISNKKSNLIRDLEKIISSSQQTAIQSVDNVRTMMYWHIGMRVFEEEQQGKERAVYGEYLTKYIAENLEPEYGRCFFQKTNRVNASVLQSIPNCECTEFAIELDSL